MSLTDEFFQMASYMPCNLLIAYRDFRNYESFKMVVCV